MLPHATVAEYGRDSSQPRCSTGGILRNERSLNSSKTINYIILIMFSLSETEKTKSRLMAMAISGFPPDFILEPIKNEIDPNLLKETKQHWLWTGISLDAFFSGTSDPIDKLGLENSVSEEIKHNANKYLQLSILVFQGEDFLRGEAHAIGIPWIWQSRSDLVKQLALEDCLAELWVSFQECWESHSQSQVAERVRDINKFFTEDIQITRGQKVRWQREDNKLQRQEQPIGFWTRFCCEVFTKHRKQLPNFNAWVSSMNQGSHPKKWAVINRQAKRYPGRGKSEKF